MKFLFNFVLAILLISLTVMVHEAGHALIAILNGIPIQQAAIGIPIFPYIKFYLNGVPILLSPWLIGGSVNVDLNLINQLGFIDQIMFYTAGIWVNLTIGILLPSIPRKPSQSIEVDEKGIVGPVGVFKIALKTLSDHGVILGSLAFLKATNLGLGLFNFLPIFPLDGAKILETIAIFAFGAENIQMAILVERLIGGFIILFIIIRSLWRD